MLELVYGNKKEGIFLNYNPYSELYVLDLKSKTYFFKDSKFPENVRELKESREDIGKYLREKNISDKILEEVIQETL